MAVHIRHGSPGSFKTAAAVWIDILAWLREGRVVYTNIRGMKSVPDIEIELKETMPDTADLIVVDTDSHEDRQRFAAWFHWLPLGAAICIDEGQFIYPSRRDFKPESLDYPGGLNQATADQRPPDIFTAIDKHRHYNWDVCVTTPNIKKLPEWLRSVVEAAYHHKNMEHIPFYGKRKARIHRHDPSTSGTSLNKQSQYQLKRIPVTVHALYGSTITGHITRNRAEQNPLKNPRLLGFLILSIFSIVTCVYLVTSGGNGSDTLDTAQDRVTSPRDAASRVYYQDAPGGSPVGRSPSALDHMAPDASSTAWGAFSAYMPGVSGIVVAGWVHFGDITRYYYRVTSESRSIVVDGTWLADAGFSIDPVSDCSQDLSRPGFSSAYRILCAPRDARPSEPSEEGGAVGARNLSVIPFAGDQKS